MKTLYSILTFLILLFMACRDDDSVSENCEIYALDIIDDTYRTNWLWLTDDQREVTYSTVLSTGSGSGAAFVNAEGACDEKYTVSVGRELAAGAAAGRWLYFSEFHEVPNGTLIDVANFERSLRPRGEGIHAQSFVVEHCPPVDSIQFITRDDQFDTEGEPIVRYEFFYSPADSTLIIEHLDGPTSDFDALLALHLTGTQVWQGRVISLESPNLPNSIAFNDNFVALVPQWLHLNWPDANVQQLEVLVNTVPGESMMRKCAVALSRGKTKIRVLRFPDTGPWIVRARWRQGERLREMQEVFSTLPTEITFDSRLEGEVTDLAYPEIELMTEEADYVHFRRNRLSEIFAERRAVIPVESALQRLRFAAATATADELDEQAENYHEVLFESGLSVTFFRYPDIPGYADYFSWIISGRVSESNWIRTQRYEKLAFTF